MPCFDGFAIQALIMINAIFGHCRFPKQLHAVLAFRAKDLMLVNGARSKPNPVSKLSIEMRLREWFINHFQLMPHSKVECTLGSRPSYSRYESQLQSFFKKRLGAGELIARNALL